MERVALAERDHVLGKRPRSLRAGERGSDALPLDEVGDQIAQGGPAMSGFASEFESCIEVSHGFSRAYKPAVSSGVGGAVWLGSGGQMMWPRSSNFIPRLRPILCRISLISLSDFRPKFLVFSISFSLFCTSSRMLWMFAFFRQLYERTESSSSSTERSKCSRRGSCAVSCGVSTVSIGSSKLMKMLMWSFTSLAARPMESCGVMAPLVHTSIINFS